MKVALLPVVALTARAQGPRLPTFPTGLLAVILEEGDQAPKQTPVGVSLSPGWQPTIIDGIAIPDEELSGGTRQPGEFFAPGEDMVIKSVATGRICAQVIAIPTIDIEVDNTSTIVGVGLYLDRRLGHRRF